MKERNIFCILSLFLALLIGYGCTDSPPEQYQEQNNSSSSRSLTPREEIGVAENLLAKNFVVILDGSGSMDESACNDQGGRSKIEVVKQALDEWAKTVPPDANLGIVIFNRGRWFISGISNSRQPFAQTIDKLMGPGGGTPLASAFMAAHKMLTQQMKSQLGYGEYNIVCLTDGVDNDGRENLSYWVGRVLEEPIRIYTIGFCIGSEHALNQPGRVIYSEAGNLEEIRRGLAETLAESENFDPPTF